MINWDIAPEGTTHYDPEAETWVKQTPQLWYYWRDGSINRWVQLGDQEAFEDEIVDSLIQKPTTNKPIKSDGLSSSYYTIPLDDKSINRICKSGAIETEVIIQYGFDNDFDFGNTLKSLKRLFECVNGGGKEGNDMMYEINKIKYSLKKIEDRYVE